MKPPLCTFIAAISACAAIFFYFGYLEIGRFTGGKLKKLEEIDKALAEKLDAWHPVPERWRIAGRLLIFLCAASAVTFFLLSFTSVSDSLERHHSLILWSLLVTAVVFYATELSSTPITLTGNARIVRFFIPVFRVAAWCLFPFVWLIELPPHIRQKRDAEQDENTNVTTAEDEILSLIDKKEEGEASETIIDDIEEDERRIVTGAFQLNDTTVHEIMTPRVDIDAIDADSTVEELTELILKSGHSRIPVYKENIDQIIGVAFAKDLLNREKISKAHSLEELIRPPFYTPESKIIGDLLAEFQQQKTHFAIVIDEYGGTSGIVTFEDILEELVGEIQDEYDTDESSESEMKPDAGGWYTVDARTMITDLAEQLELEFPDDADYDTIGGYLASETGRILQKGDKHTTDILEIEVLDSSPRCVKKLRFKKIANG